MRDSQKTRNQLLNELHEARRQLEVLAAAEVDRKKVGDELSKSEEKFYKAFLSSPDMIIITSIPSGRYIEVNESFAEVTGYSREELIGHTADEFNLWVDTEELREMIRILGENGHYKNEEYRFRTKSGDIRNWLCSGEVINIDGENCMIAVAVDITESKKMEQSLRESQEKFARAFSSSPQSVAITTLKEGSFVEVNESYCRITGLKREELIGHTARELKLWTNPADRERIMRLLKQKGRIDNEELVFRSKSGDLFTLLFSAQIITIGGVECMISSSADLTGQKKIEAALRDSGEKFSKAFSLSPSAICLFSIEDSRFFEVNDSFLRFTGYTREEVIGHTPDELNLWVNRDDLKNMTKSLRETGMLVNMEIKSRMKSGEICTGLFSAQTIEIGGRRLMILVITDITEQVKAKEALRESEEKFAIALRSSPESISITRLSDGVYLEVNDTFTRVCGFTREEAIGHTSDELNVWVHPGRKYMTERLAERGRIINEEYRFRTKSGEIRTGLFSAERIMYGGENCVLSVVNDITDYKRIEVDASDAENLREVDKLRTELLANVSHELRTPLASIKGFATMLMDYDRRLTPSEKREYLQTIDKNCDRLTELIEQLLEMSRLGVGMMTIRKTPADVSKLCRDIIARARLTAPDHVFVLDLPARLPRISLDEKRIREVLDNIISNSVKYSEAGTEIVLSVRKTRSELLFTITDYGSGIPQEDLPHVFERTFVSSRRQKPETSGAGLGLPICKALVGAHGGKIWLESEEGVGTCCFFTLPLDAKPRKR